MREKISIGRREWLGAIESDEARLNKFDNAEVRKGGMSGINFGLGAGEFED